MVLARDEARKLRVEASALARDKRAQKQLDADAALREKAMGRAKAPSELQQAVIKGDSDDEYVPPSEKTSRVRSSRAPHSASEDAPAPSYGVFDVPTGAACDSGGAPLIKYPARVRKRSARGAAFDALKDSDEVEEEDEDAPAPAKRARTSSKAHGAVQSRGTNSGRGGGGESSGEQDRSNGQQWGKTPVRSRGHGRGRGRGKT